MNIMIEFTKMSGAGNDFVLIDNMDDSLQLDKTKLAVALCSQHFGIGADGLLLLEQSLKADFMMRYYNADGSSGGMCGNGGRCVARYAYMNGIANQHLRFDALDHIYKAEVLDETVKLQMKDPTHLKTHLLIKTKSGSFQGHFIDTGSPHVVIESTNLNTLDVETIGREVRYNSLFVPEGANVNFMNISKENKLDIRTYERGVEAETLACGTGSVASALIASHLKGVKSPVTIRVKSGEELRVYFEYDDKEFSNIFLEGSAHILFSGKLFYDTELNSIQDFSVIASQSVLQR